MARTAHTAGLTSAGLTAVRALPHDAFGGGLTDEDRDHTPGGVHALVHDGRGPAAHGAVVTRRVRHRGRWRRVGHVEGVAVRAGARRRGLGGRVMAALEGIVARAHDFGSLSAGDGGAALRTARGRHPWGGPIAALGPDGVVPLPDEEGSTRVRPAPGGPEDRLVSDRRDGDVL
ncbi:Aminoglycoside 2'-N-acetyltransferase [Streptomyces sp. enrichment culture]|uniref:GNAT family N-acetyltransferase n=1 Tax=Streptomyces sp. enrichment culture TaxID=1795815 RepID=UPI003F556974